jgi:hypothetical protein
MKKAYIEPETITLGVKLENFITAGSATKHQGTGSYYDGTQTIGDKNADGSTNGQSSDGSGNRAKGNLFWGE